MLILAKKGLLESLDQTLGEKNEEKFFKLTNDIHQSMPIPKYNTIRLPLLKYLKDKKEKVFNIFKKY